MPGIHAYSLMLSDAQIQTKELAMVSLFADPILQLAVEASPTAMTNLEWFVNQFMKRAKKKCNRKGTSVFAYCDKRLADRGRVDSDVLFLPFLHGNNLKGIIRSGFATFRVRIRKTICYRRFMKGLHSAT